MEGGNSVYLAWLMSVISSSCLCWYTGACGILWMAEQNTKNSFSGPELSCSVSLVEGTYHICTSDSVES